jgi:class 3 adenylate cyclase/pimeloyl-ACP methyl ester carboxylesterase
MDRVIRYCTTDDGVRIAYATEGHGPPLLVCPLLIESFSLDHLVPIHEAFFARLGEGRQLIRFDGRGTGLSQRDFYGALSPEAHCRDLDAVVTATRLEKVAFFAPLAWGAIAMQYAVTHPDRVAALILWGTYATPTEAWTAEVLESLASLCRTNWAAAAQLFGDTSTREGHAEFGLQYGALNAASTSGDVASRFILEGGHIDMRPMLSRITAPTLVMHRLQSAMIPVAAGQALAAAIPGAVFVPLGGHTGHWAPEDPDETLDAINAFLGSTTPGASRVAMPAAQSASGTAIILFTDIVDSTALTEQLGDAAFRAASRTLDAAMRTAMRENGGAPVDGKVLGDGVMSVFTSASQAIAAARRCIDLSAESELRLHIGLHAGDVIHEQGNVYGGAVNIASRICGLSAPGEILVSGTVRDLARTSAGVAFDDRGEHALKGIDYPVRVFAVGPESG